MKHEELLLFSLQDVHTNDGAFLRLNHRHKDYLLMSLQQTLSNVNKYCLPVEEYGAHSTSPTAVPKSNVIIGLLILESHILIVQSALHDKNTLGWKLFHLTAYTAR